MTDFNIPEGELADWLNVLKKYQRDQIDILVKDADPEVAAEVWVTNIGHPNIAHFGGIADPKPFWQLLKAEFYDFICNKDSYKEEKEELSKQGDAGKLVIASTMSSAIGAQIGLSAVVIVPAIVLLLFSAAKIGRNAFCKLPRPEPKTRIQQPSRN